MPKHKGTHRSWSDMKQRCCNPKCNNYPNYGGRGITICAHWLSSFDNFLKDMGPRPHGLTIERIDVNGDYEPKNCRWATRLEQRRNQRNCRYLTLGSERKTFQEWARTIGCDREAIARRAKKGMTDVEILTTPFRGERIIEFNGRRLPVGEWSRITGIMHGTIYARIRLGWSPERTLTAPVRIDSRNARQSEQESK